jgi:hypothetical protein
MSENEGVLPIPHPGHTQNDRSRFPPLTLTFGTGPAMGIQNDGLLLVPPTPDRPSTGERFVLSGSPTREDHRLSRWALGLDVGGRHHVREEGAHLYFGVFYQRVFTDGSRSQFVQFIAGVWFG